jgi:hypothetical protein
MRLRTRVAQLARMTQTAPSRCANCRTWSPVVFLRDGEDARPERCPICGRVAPIRLIRLYHLVQFDPTEPLFDGLSVLAGDPHTAESDQDLAWSCQKDALGVVT